MRNFVMCLLLFCIFGASFADVNQDNFCRTSVNRFYDISEDDLKELQPKVATAFDQLSRKHDDFVYTITRLVGGKSQVIGCTRYMLLVEAAPIDNAADVKKCNVRILQNSSGEFDDVEVKCEHKDETYRYTKQ